MEGGRENKVKWREGGRESKMEGGRESKIKWREGGREGGVD